ncbi:NAD(P)H-binding protein [Nordella sp. HKS 07]|uniref:NAD(P)H-binding protein n=1 Tax=Nordella sp. HKS 07 TaxID=2712222 RepID=UPI0013E1D515|nr:NAD(P)H-binding protein [Nordella sp. HKS 07]QIG47426.1 NAD(P)H-binding protein [Nordella sp. HKS 07]
MILVTGAGGYIGGKAVYRLRDLAMPVVAMGRDEARLRKSVPPETPLAIADYDDPGSLDRAFAGITGLLFVAGDGFAGDMMRQHANVIDAAERQRIAHVVFTSIVDIEDSSPFYYATVYRDAEQRLEASRFAVAIIRCGLYCEFIHRHWLAEPMISLPLADARIAPVSRDDVADAAVEAVVERADGVWNMTGSRSYSMPEISRVASAAMGRGFTYRDCPPDEYLTRLEAELDDPWPVAFSSMCASIREGRFAQVSARYPASATRRPEDFESYLRRNSTAACPTSTEDLPS